MSDGGAEIITFWNLEEHSDEADRAAAAVVDPAWLWLRGDGQRQVAKPYSGVSRNRVYMNAITTLKIMVFAYK